MTARNLENVDEAALWVARMDGDDWSSEQEQQLQSWLAEDGRREGALLRAQSLWYAVGNSTEKQSTFARPTGRASFRRPFLWAGGAAALAASLALILIPASPENVYATEVGEIRQVPLADGSSASINSDTKVKIEIRSDARVVTLARGEAWFKVKKDPNLPFVVQAGQVRVQAVGTAFSVRNVPGGAEVLVTEGVIRAWSAKDRLSSIVVRAGGRAFIAADARIVQQRSDAAELDRELAWREGKIDLVGEALGDAVNEFNRYNERKIILEDGRFSGEEIDGLFRTDDPEGFALAVHQLLGIQADLSDPKVIRLAGDAKNIAAK